MLILLKMGLFLFTSPVLCLVSTVFAGAANEVIIMRITIIGQKTVAE